MTDRLTADTITDDQLEALYDRLDAVRALHTTEFGNEFGGLECSLCREIWPCDTIAALNGDAE
ncbi:hypothetical protein BX265_6157 [Streptomyces sp. TLI_235]|nr:hypothetical protein [Streptomyces sp. TLI_235]PBC71547.1 hypothetical protein BX265_6157 [Streptomyces sp. TLI_235]